MTCDDEGVPENFEVLSQDPHGFDADNDGIGCESESNQNNTGSQDPAIDDGTGSDDSGSDNSGSDDTGSGNSGSDNSRLR